MPRKKKDAPQVPPDTSGTQTHEVVSKTKTKAFEPVMYISRAKAFTLWVNEGKDMVQFNNNGLVGVFIAKTQKECEQIEASSSYQAGEVWRANGQVPGSGTPVRAGVRSALEVPTPPVEPEIQKIIEDSNQAAKRPIAAE